MLENIRWVLYEQMEVYILLKIAKTRLWCYHHLSVMLLLYSNIRGSNIIDRVSINLVFKQNEDSL